MADTVGEPDVLPLLLEEGVAESVWRAVTEMVMEILSLLLNEGVTEELELIL